MTTDRPPLAMGALDRDAPTRMDPLALERAWGEPGARLLRLRGVEVPTISGDEGVRLALVETSGEYSLLGPGAGNGESGGGSSVGHVYLGRLAGEPVFAVSVADEPSDHGIDEREAADQGETWQHPFVVGALLSDAERELLTISSALLRWHENARYSPLDGSALSPAYGGWARLDAQGDEWFPRTDPAVIVLIEHGEQVLLGSNALWEAGRYSLLAGFVEAGESLEQAVAREVFEESGVRLGNIEYVTSQPWPFPRSLMLGFRARLAEGFDPSSLTPDRSEISDLRWFSRHELRDPVTTGITLPGSLSIARWLLDFWLDEERPTLG